MVGIEGKKMKTKLRNFIWKLGVFLPSATVVDGKKESDAVRE